MTTANAYKGGVFHLMTLLPIDKRKEIADRLRAWDDALVLQLMFNWRGAWARPEQIINYSDGNVLLETARGWGKTRALGEHIREEVEAKRARKIGIIVPKYPHLRNVIGACFREIYPESECPEIRDGGRRFVWANGAEAFGFSSEAMTNIRGHEFDLLIGDEVAYWEDPMDTFLDALPTLRRPRSRWVCATTPPVDPTQVNAVDFMRYLRQHCDRHTIGKMRDNNRLSKEKLNEMLAGMVPGSIRWRVEVLGEPVEQVEGALWEAPLPIADSVPDLERIVIAVDVAGSANETSDETGIVAVGEVDGVAYILEDASGSYSPTEWANIVANLYDKWQANYVVAERNYGGDMVKTTLEAASHYLPVNEVHAKHGKLLRAEPVSALYKRGLVKHAPSGLDKLETQMLKWSPLLKGSAIDDRVDAMVYAVTELLIGSSPMMLDDLSVTR